MITRWYSFDRRRCTVQFRWASNDNLLSAFRAEHTDSKVKRLSVKSIEIAGAFTDWEPRLMLWKPSRGYVKSFSLVCGFRYEFRYRLNKKFWFSGNDGDGIIRTQRGELNSYLEL